MKQNPVPYDELAKLENFTIDEFTRWARISRASVYRAIKDGSLVAHKLRGRTIVRRADALKYAAGTPIR